ncbi:S49 family peptidase [Polymorphum gilvum]|uniref:Peptidase S49 n=1 Tax=Polymorphum gilvum (strain LMG 25793 / CGMCC 1.9160 / SL003B-26A1) TaxID=991905 RepID=F2J6I1_POLGS|nr:S49 family peptidase [Polymorphum gilvum]ADZ72464.1 Peptidase S49 [Polymorphum gilvum SL003B-26A1]
MTRLNPLLTRLGGRPLAIAPRALDGLLAAGPMLDTRQAMLPARDAPPVASHSVTDPGIAVVPILGPLVTRGDWLTSLLGASDYGEVASAVEAALADPTVRAVLVEIDSPGGEVGGLFDLVDRLVSLRQDAQKPLWAVASESALSAAFAIASVADRLYVTRTAEVGSIGVVAIHVDESVADVMAGLKWTLVHAGDRKIEGNAHAPLSDTALSAIQADVDALHADLVTLVARNRNMSPDAVRATEAAIYRGQRGIGAGLADKLGTVDLALVDLARALDPPRLITGASQRARAHQPSRRKTAMTVEPDLNPAAEDAAVSETCAPDPETPEAPLSAPPAGAPEATDTPNTDQTAERLRAEYAEIAAIAAQGARLGVAIDAADAMAKGVAPHALRSSILDALAARAEASSVVAVAPSLAGSPSSNGGESPIVRRARERASANRS